ncbi:MAG: hypothetical protein Kow0025_11800 [Thermodesulfovibrionales bacterium]
MRRIAATLLLSVLCALPVLARAAGGEGGGFPLPGDELGLFQEIPSVFSASKYEQKATQAPSSVSIVTADEIRKYGYRTFSEVLQSIRGFQVTNDRNYIYLGIRGFGLPADYNNRVLILVDGHPINEAVYDSTLLGAAFPVEVDLIDRVEVVRGPSSSLYGNSAFFGVINVITKDGRHLRGAQVSGEAGSLRTYKGMATYGTRLNSGLEVLVSASSLGSRGEDSLFYPEFDDPATNDGVAEGRDYERYEKYFVKAS